VKDSKKRARLQDVDHEDIQDVAHSINNQRRLGSEPDTIYVVVEMMDGTTSMEFCGPATSIAELRAKLIHPNPETRCPPALHRLMASDAKRVECCVPMDQKSVFEKKAEWQIKEVKGNKCTYLECWNDFKIYNADRPFLSERATIRFHGIGIIKDESRTLSELFLKPLGVVTITVDEQPISEFLNAPLVTLPWSKDDKWKRHVSGLDFEMRWSVATNNQQDIHRYGLNSARKWSQQHPISLIALQEAIFQVKTEVHGFRWSTGYVPVPSESHPHFTHTIPLVLSITDMDDPLQQTQYLKTHFQLDEKDSEWLQSDPLSEMTPGDSSLTSGPPLALKSGTTYQFKVGPSWNKNSEMVLDLQNRPHHYEFAFDVCVSTI